jgi:hypothetical protein
MKWKYSANGLKIYSSDMGLLLDQGKVDQDVTLRMPPVKGLRQQYQKCG